MAWGEDRVVLSKILREEGQRWPGERIMSFG